MVNIDRSGHAIHGEIRIRCAENERAVDFAGIDLHPQRVARTKRVFLLDSKGKPESFAASITSPDTEVAGWFLDHRNGQIHLVLRTRDLLCFNRNFLEKAQAVYPVT